MNELEYFVLSTHGKRCDIMRYMQQLRDLDEWIEYHLSHLRSIAAERVAYQKAQARQKQSVNCGGTRGRGCRGRGRGQASAAAAESTLHAHHVHDVDASPQEEGGGNNGDADTVAGAYAAELHRQFAWHETCVQRRCHEREALAAELAERCSEVQLSMASRLANFAAVADVPVTELSGRETLHRIITRTPASLTLSCAASLLINISAAAREEQMRLPEGTSHTVARGTCATFHRAFPSQTCRQAPTPPLSHTATHISDGSTTASRYGLHTRCRQQRLFTGALFPEALNDQLAAFARRHKLQSDVWVPRKAFDTALKPYNVYILPRATLCDLTLSSGGGMGDVTAAIGIDRCLVNAEQTSNQHLLEGFVDFMVSCLTPPEQLSTRIQIQSFPPAATAGTQVACRTAAALPLSGRQTQRKNSSEYFSAASGECTTPLLAAAADSSPSPALLPDPTWDTLAPFRHPLALNGSLLVGTDTTAQLLKWQQESYKWSNYWGRLRGASWRRQSLYSVCDTEVPGRYNPFFCVRYAPHTYTNLIFPLATAVLMRHRAVEHKYVSRLWLTLKQAEELFGTSLLPERANDEPVVYCNHFTAGMEATAFYCADQFVGGNTIFPTARDLDIAAKGVRLPSAKLRAYPLLARLLDQYDEGKTTDGASDDRPGTDQTMPDAGRHAEFFQHRQRCGAIRLHGFWKQEAERNYLQSTRMAGTLARQCLLCDYPRPLFFSHRALLAFDLRLREGEQGIVQTRLPVRVNKLLAWCKGECWFNVSQLREPAVAQELMDHPPVHFLTRQSLQGAVAVNCCRAQLARRCDTAAAAVPSSSPTSSVPARCNFSAEWIPAYVLDMTGWRLREGAQGVPYVSLAAGAAFKSFPLRDNILFSMADVSLHDAAKDWLRRYTPVDQEGYPFLRGLRQAMTLRAFERGYRSHHWLIHRVRKNGDFSSPLLALRGAFKPVCMSASQPLLTTSAFAKAPFVRMGNFEFVNAEEVAWMGRTHPWKGAAARESGAEEPDAPLLQMSGGARFQVKPGVGMSAESLLRHSVRETDNAAALGDTATFDRRDVGEVDDCREVDEEWTSGDLSRLLYVQ